MSTKVLLATVESDVLKEITDAGLKKKIKAVFKQHITAQDGPKFTMRPVTSSNVKAVGYDHVSETLRIKFTTGAIYDYLKVPANVHVDLVTAQSIGQFLNTVIIPNYGTVKIDD